MSDDVNKNGKKLTAYERWELPCLEDSNKKVEEAKSGLLIKTEATVTYEEVDNDELVYEPLTASQLEEIRSAAYDEGFSQGLDEGSEKGFEQGRAEGYTAGHVEGYEIGKAEGFDAGHNEAKDQANSQFEQIESVLKTLVEELSKPLESTRSIIEETVYKTIKRVVDNIVQLEISEHSSRILKSQLASIFDSIEDYEGKIKLSLNPKDVELLNDYQVFKGFNLYLEPLDSLLPGGFVLESKNFFIDGAIESRLEKIFSEIEQVNTQIDTEMTVDSDTDIDLGVNADVEGDAVIGADTESDIDRDANDSH
ncbi:FliH/SctL family protein [Marinomonas algicola]|uniref:FliH/SctL family protein n=1 Tax=Marinomonas algicola TaxID=2773454 RepID=UPI00174A5657|nr:FliH/SctL family protein [Marinomonas algicola]